MRCMMEGKKELIIKENQYTHFKVDPRADNFNLFKVQTVVRRHRQSDYIWNHCDQQMQSNLKKKSTLLFKDLVPNEKLFRTLM